jgi:hypothetical protein
VSCAATIQAAALSSEANHAPIEMSGLSIDGIGNSIEATSHSIEMT